MIRGLAIAFGVLVAAVVASALVLALRGGPSDAPVPVAWDRQACAFCKMHVGDPAFAAQVHLRSGDVLFFDDPGCWFLHERDAAPDVREVYFRAHDRDVWLRAADTAFVLVEPSPMGFGLAAVAKDRETLDLAAARRRALERGSAARAEPASASAALAADAHGEAP